MHEGGWILKFETEPAASRNVDDIDILCDGEGNQGTVTKEVREGGKKKRGKD